MKKITKGITTLWMELTFAILYIITLYIDPTPTKAVFAQVGPGIITAMTAIAGAYLTANVMDNKFQGQYFNPALAESNKQGDQ
ncbi:MAG: hypothetical protein WC820_01560 [Spirochaetales bacterium]|jgi:hypothetical protein